MLLEPIRTDDGLQAAFVLPRRVFPADKATAEAGDRHARVARIEACEHPQHEVGMAEAAIAGLPEARPGRLLTGDELQQALTPVPRPTP